MHAVRLSLLGLLFLACSDGKRSDHDAGMPDDAASDDEETGIAESDGGDGPVPPLDGATPAEGGSSDAEARDASMRLDGGRLPPGPPVQVIAGSAHNLHMDYITVCKLDQTGDIVCRTPFEGWSLNHKGPFRSFSLYAAYQVGCGLTADGTAQCWNDSEKTAVLCKRRTSDCPGGGAPPAGEKFKQVAVAHESACGLTMDGRVLCWGAASHRFATPPVGSDFAQLTRWLEGPICALRSNGSVVCPSGEVATGPFQQVAFGGSGACGLRPDGSVACWDEHAALAMQPGVAGLAQISRDGSALCGLTKDGAAKCWSTTNDFFSRVPPPPGPFLAIANSVVDACGLRGDGEVECWGSSFGNGSGNETCKLEEARLSLDGQPEQTYFARFKDDRLNGMGLRSSAVPSNGFISLSASVPNAADPRSASLDAGVLSVQNSLWLLAASDSAAGAIYCTRPGDSGRMERKNDELLLDWGDLSLLGRCPGSQVVAGSLSICRYGGCSNATLSGTLAGQTVSVAERRKETWTSVYVGHYSDGSTLMVRHAADGVGHWGIYLTPPDGAGLSEALCVGRIDVAGTAWSLSDFTSLGRCRGDRGHTLKGCVR